MRVLMLSQDILLFKTESAVARRIASYGSIFDELDIVVFGVGGAGTSVTLAHNVHAFGVEGKSKFSVFFNGQTELLRLANLKKYDVISSQDPFFLGLLALLVSWRRRIPLHVQLHTDCFSAGFASHSLRRFIESGIAVCVLKRAQCIRVVSERIARSVRKITKTPVSILPIAVTPHVGFTKPNMGGRVHGGVFKILAVSRLTKEKQVHLLIDAMNMIQNAELTIVGDGSLRKELEARVHRLGLQDRVHFVGWQADTSSFYQRADVFVQVSRYEGYGMTLIEAALAGLPIVTTDVGIVGEILRDKEDAVVVTSDARVIAHALICLSTEPSRALELGQSAQSAALKVQSSPEEYLKKYKEVMQTCMALKL